MKDYCKEVNLSKLLITLQFLGTIQKPIGFFPYALLDIYRALLYGDLLSSLSNLTLHADWMVDPTRIY